MIINNKQLEVLFLDNNNIGVGAINIVKALKNITSLKTLGLNKNDLPKQISDELAGVVKSNCGLQLLTLNSNDLQSSAVIILQSLSHITTLKVLNIESNLLGEKAGEALASVVLHNPGLEELHISDNNLGDGILKIAKALQYTTSVKSLKLGNNNISKAASDDLALAIKSNKYLEKLQLFNTNLQFAADAILQSLSTISALKLLNMNNNQITEEAGEALASVILHNTGLEELHLSNNNLGDGILIVAKALQHITSLRSLDLGDNNIPEKASCEIALAVKSNKHLEKLVLCSNNLESSAIAIFQALSSISSLEALNIDNCQIDEAGGEVLASVINKNPGLKQLYCGRNNIQNSAINVTEALQAITTLKVLDLGNNNLPELVCIKLAAVVYSNNSLEKVILDRSNLHSAIDFILQALHNISKLKLLRVYNNSITGETGNFLASVISKNTELQELHVNLLRSPINIIKSLKNLSTIQSLVLCTCNISKEDEIKLAFVINNNKSLKWLSLPNVNLSQNVIIKAIATISNLNTLWLEDNLLSEEISDDLSLAISNNTLLERVILLDNMLQTGLIKIAKACSKLSNIKVLQLAHNCIIPSKVVELTSIITQNTSLERVLLGGITLNAAECFHYNINEVLHKKYYCNNTNLLSSSNHSAFFGSHLF